MPPIHSPQLMASPTGFRPYPVASNTDYHHYLADSNSSLNHPSSMPQQPHVLGAPADTSTMYQPSAQRPFHTHLETGAGGLNPATMSPNQLSGGLQTPYNGTPVMENGGGMPSPAGHPFPTVGSPNSTNGCPHWSHPYMTPGPLDNTHPSVSNGYVAERSSGRAPGRHQRGNNRGHNQRRPQHREEFANPREQYLRPPSPRTIAHQARELPRLPTNLDASEQDKILTEVNDRLSQCVFDFVAKYHLPIPLEPDKRTVQRPSDREWTEWVYLLKKLATKRQIPADILYNGQIKQLITILESSLEMRHAAKHQSRPIKDDRNVLQLISAGTQVAKILRDATAMEYLDHLYVQTEQLVYNRQSYRGSPSNCVPSLEQSVASRC